MGSTNHGAPSPEVCLLLSFSAEGTERGSHPRVFKSLEFLTLSIFQQDHASSFLLLSFRLTAVASGPQRGALRVLASLENKQLFGRETSSPDV